MKKIEYLVLLVISVFIFVSCTDIVEIADLKAKENRPSTAAPAVEKIVLAKDAEFSIDGANFEDIVRIEGTNLGDVVSLKFNDIEVDRKDIYSHYDMLLGLFRVFFPKKLRIRSILPPNMEVRLCPLLCLFRI